MAKYKWEHKTSADDVSADLIVERIDIQTISSPRRYVKVTVVFADGRVNVLHYSEDQARAMAEALTAFADDVERAPLN